MSIKIVNPKEDLYGNAKENIFLAVSDQDIYLGSGFVYPNINYHQTGDTPYLLFIDVNAKSDDARDKLFKKVFDRAIVLRALRPELKARIYSGFEPNEEKSAFYIGQGFQSQYSIVMEANIPEEFVYELPTNIQAVELKLNNEKKINDYKRIYDEIFVTPLDLDTYRAQEKKNKFKNILFYIGKDLVGGCTIYKENGFGYMEKLFIMQDFRGKGIGTYILMYV